MQSNPYVYPFVPFQDLSYKQIGNITDTKPASTQDIAAILHDTDRLKNISISQTDDIADTILNIFLHDEVRFGPQDHIVNYQNKLKEQIHTFSSDNIPIQFTILGFPFKIPVPLKTNRVYPDFGELASLKRLHSIGTYIQRIYSPGAKITVFSEGCFASAVGMNPDIANAYHRTLKRLIKEFDLDDILEVRQLGEMEEYTDDFQQLYTTKVEELREKYNQRDPAYIEKYQGSFPSVYRIVSTQMYSQNVLLDVYNDQLSDEEVPAEVKEIRNDLAQRTHEAIFRYHAYLKLRDELNFLETETPGALRLSVSPKPYRLGIQPVHAGCDKLPYHSVSVFNVETQEFSQEYLIDILRDAENAYRGVYWEEDEEDKPFYYECTRIRNS